MVENVVPAYTSEVSPVDVRGFFTGWLPFFVVGGNLWGAGMSRAFATETTKIGWQVPTGIQLVPAVILAITVWATPESPRWLLTKGRRAEAVKSLNRLRPRAEVEAGLTELEADAIAAAIEEAKQIGDGRWIDLFRGSYFRRSCVSPASTSVTSIHHADRDVAIHLPAEHWCSVHQYLSPNIPHVDRSRHCILHLHRHQQRDGHGGCRHCDGPVRPGWSTSHRNDRCDSAGPVFVHLRVHVWPDSPDQ